MPHLDLSGVAWLNEVFDSTTGDRTWDYNACDSGQKLDDLLAGVARSTDTSDGRRDSHAKVVVNWLLLTNLREGSVKKIR